MARIFLSHSSVDEREALALNRWLTTNGWDDIFLDVDPKRGLAAGERWQEALRKAADRCEAVVFVVSPAWAKSKWCLAEFLLAKSLHKQIFGVVLKEVPLEELPTEMTSEWQLCHLLGPGKTEPIQFTFREAPAQVEFLCEGLQRLKNGLKKAGLNADFFPWPPKNEPERSPYRGLKPLDAQDAAVFFGRDVEILRGLDALRSLRDSFEKRLFVILGPSGTGKSSFLRAGLIPRLQRDDRHFHPLPVIRPERDPLSGESGLAHALSRAQMELGLRPITSGQIRQQLKGGASELTTLLEEIQTAAAARLVGSASGERPPTLVLSVDQAEELFNSDAGKEAAAFLQLIGDQIRSDIAAPDKGYPPLIVAFTIRSDRYEPLQTARQFAGLQSLVFDDLKPMSTDRFREVIVGPAKRASIAGSKLEVEPKLVKRLVEVSAVGGDTLPLLGLTLARLFRDYGQDGDLRLDEYTDMGGLSSVIKTEAESILSRDEPTRREELEALRTAFIPELVTINPDTGEPMRRVAPRSRLPSASLPLIDALATKRLLLTDQRDGIPVVEVAHEAILRQWDILQGWLGDERATLHTCVAVERAAAAWQEHRQERNQGNDWLLEGERLSSAEALLTNPGYKKRLQGCQPFLAASRRRQNERLVKDRRQRARLIGALTGAVVLLIAATFAILSARTAKDRAETNLLEATVLRIGAEGAAMTSGNQAGGTLRGLLTVLAAHRLAEHGNPRASAAAFGYLQNAYLRTQALASLMEGHGGDIVSPDGRYIVSVSDNNTLSLWDAASGTLIGRPFQEHTGMVSIVAFSPDSRRFVTIKQPVFGEDSSMGNTLRLWDTATGAPIGLPLQGQTDVAFSPDSRRLVSGSNDNTLRLWDAATGAPIGQPLQGHTDSVKSLAFSPDSRRLASASHDKTLRVWDAANGTPIGNPILLDAKERLRIIYSPDGQRLVSDTWQKTLRLWDATTGASLCETTRGLHTGWITDVAFSPDGRRLVSASEDKSLRLWDVATCTPLGEPLKVDTEFARRVAFSADSRRVVSVFTDNTVRLWDAASGATTSQPLAGHSDWVTSVAFSHDGRHLVSGSNDTTLRLRNVDTGVPIGEPLRGHTLGVTSVAFSHDGRRLVSGSNDKTLRLWNVDTGVPIGEPLQGHTLEVTSVAFSPDGRRVVSGSRDKTLRLWNVDTGVPIGEPLQGHTLMVTSVAFSPDGLHLVSGSADNTIRLWDATTGAPSSIPLQGHTSGVQSVAFSPDSRRVVSASDDGNLLVWNAITGTPFGAPLKGHSTQVYSVAFSPNGRHLVSTSLDKTVRLWDADTGAPIGQQLQGHTSAVLSIAFSPDGRRVVSGSWDNSLRIWPVLDAWAYALCAKLPRNMSRQEWKDWVSPDIDYSCQCPGLPVQPDDPKDSAPAETCPTPYAPHPVATRNASPTR